MKPELKANGQELTALSLFILLTIHARGPQSQMSLWGHCKQGEALLSVMIEVATLDEDGFIERIPSHKNPGRYSATDLNGQAVQYWQLTEKGRQHVAAQESAQCNPQQEVELGSSQI